MKTIIFTLFGFGVPLWLVITVGFGLLWLVFELLSVFKNKKRLNKRKKNINDDFNNI